MKLRDPVVDVVASHYYSHKFVCVAPYSTDTLLLINIPKTMLEKVIKVSIKICETMLHGEGHQGKHQDTQDHAGEGRQGKHQDTQDHAGEGHQGRHQDM
jgi:hypothetical protein